MTDENAPAQDEQRMVRKVEVQAGTMAVQGEGDQPVVMLRLESVPLSDFRSAEAPVSEQNFLISAEFVSQIAQLMLDAVPDPDPAPDA